MPSVSTGTSVYEIPCACGKLLTISAGQAGTQIVCDCGATVDVPTIRELRKQFDPGNATVEKKPARSASGAGGESYSRSAFAAVGILLIVIGALTFGSLYFFQKSIPQDFDPLLKWRDEQIQNVDKIPPADMFFEWQAARDRGLGEHNAIPQAINKERAQGAWYGAYFGLGIGGVGLLLVLLSMVLPRAGGRA